MDSVELTQALTRIQTLNPGGDEHECAEYIGSLLKSAGFQVQYFDFAPRRTSVVASIGGGTDVEKLCFAGHIDTVPLGLQQWSVDPFAGDIQDGKLYGRGVTDMKAGIAAFISAALEMRAVAANGPGLLLIMAAGEETGCEGSRALAPDVAAAHTIGAMVVAEPTGNIPKVGHRGAYWMRMSATGKTAHGSMPEQGINALYKAARAVRKLEDFDFNIARHPYLGGNSLNVGNLQSGLNVNSVPDFAVMEVDVRTIPGVDHDHVREGFIHYLGDDIAAIEPFVDVKGVWTDPDIPWIQQVYDIADRYLGARPEVGALPFFTDASTLTPAFGGVPTIILGPGETEMAHKTDEYCFVDKIPQAVEIYKDIIANWHREAD